MARLALIALVVLAGCEFPSKHYYYEGQRVYQPGQCECPKKEETNKKEAKWSATV